MKAMENLKTVTGQVFNIQRFSTHDGPGIRTTVFFKGCPLRCFWCQNPESQDLAPVLLHNREFCVACGGCKAVCESGAVAVDGGFAVFDREKCAACGLCVGQCPAEGLSLAGRTVSTGDVMREILKDRLQYVNSGGGVTLSGGEPAMQPEFALSLLKACRSEGLHTVVETCGFAPWKTFEKFAPYVDIFYWDIKKTDAAGHASGTGFDNVLILENAERMAHTGKDMRFRMPLIPGFNDTDDDVLSLKEFVTTRCGRTGAEIDLLRYNNYGESKFGSLGLEEPRLVPQAEEDIERLSALLE